MPKLIKSFNNSIVLILIVYCQTAISIEQKLDPKYGNGQSTKFIDAMYGRSPDITDAELQAIEKSIPPRITSRFFIRFGANNCTSSVSKVVNTSVQTATLTAKVVNGNQITSSKYGVELAFGYRWDKLSLELEALATEDTRFDKNPLFSNQPGTLTSIVKAQGVFVNAYYDFISLMAFRAFVGLGAGAGINRTNSNFSGNPVSTGISFTRRRVAGAYNLVLGCKINLASQLFINGAFRYTNFAGFGNIKTIATSNVEWRDELQNLHLEGQHSIYGISIGLTHIFI
ncbi:MAG: outer membrane beta-barrel protein [Gammaproteobacteria bacterium]|jgi:opacity protein-like surface antigen